MIRLVRRWALNALTDLSLLLCVATCVLWVRSYRAQDTWVWERVRYDRVTDPAALAGVSTEDRSQPVYAPQIVKDGIISNRGSIRFCRLRYVGEGLLLPANLKDWAEEDPPGRRFRWETDPPNLYFRPSLYETSDHRNDSVLIDRFGFFIGGMDIPGMFHDSNMYHQGQTCLPAWFVALVLFILPARRFFSFARSRGNQIAGRCGRCSYDLTGNVSDVCPECGARVGGGNEVGGRDEFSVEGR